MGANAASDKMARSVIINQVRAYWEALREGPALPRRARIDPRGIEGALEGAFILDRIAPGMARFRLAGMKLVDLMGMDVRGMPLSAMFDPMGRNRLAEGLEQVFGNPAILDLHLEAERGIGRPALSARMLILPLQGDNGHNNLALGCLVTEGEPGRRPRRFFIANARLEPLVTDAKPASAPASAPGMAEAAQPFSATTKAKARGHHLRLVKSGD